MKYQQGDVLFIKSDADVTFSSNGECYIRPNDYTKVKRNDYEENTVVALGEVTGHSHTFYKEDQKGVSINTYGRAIGVQGLGAVPNFVEIKPNHDGKPANSPERFAVIKHEEHKPLSLPPGLYKTRIVREFDHLSGRERNVVD